MPSSKKRKVVKVEEKREIRAINPTKSRAGRIVILVLAIGMFAAMLIAAIIGMIDVL